MYLLKNFLKFTLIDYSIKENLIFSIPTALLATNSDILSHIIL